MQLYEYPSYADYRLTQYRANKAKLDQVWVRRANVERIAARLAEWGAAPRFGLCHGSRNGREQALFAELLGCEVLGTEIAPTAELFPHTVRWDFHKAKAEWAEAVDFIYSNSLDHARDPVAALTAWLQCLRVAGVLIIEWGSQHAKSDETDPFGATVAEVCEMIRRCGGEIALVEDAPERPDRVTELKLIYARRTRVAAIPSQGGREIGRYLREWAAVVPDGHAIVELGCWLGAGTAQMALGVRDGGRDVTIHAFDRFRATGGEVRKAAAHGVELAAGADTSSWVRDALIEAGLSRGVDLHIGDIGKAKWRGRSIGLHVDDACKREPAFLHALRTFGPHWIAGLTVVVLMDFWYFEKRPGPWFRFQHDWMGEHTDSFEVLHERLPGVSAAAFRYVGGEPWAR